MIHSDELAITEQLGLTENQVDNLVKEMFGENQVAHARKYLRGSTSAVRFDGQEIVYFRDIGLLINHLMFGVE